MEEKAPEVVGERERVRVVVEERNRDKQFLTFGFWTTQNQVDHKISCT